MAGLATFVAQDQSGHHPGLWQHQNDLPWSPSDAFCNGLTVLTQPTCLSPWMEEVLYGPTGGSAVQHLNPSSVYPPQIFSPLSIASGPSSEMESLNSAFQWPDMLATQLEESFLDDDAMFPAHYSISGTHAWEQADGENSQFLPLTSRRQSPSSNQRWPHGDTQRPVPSFLREFASSDWSLPPNPQVSNDTSQRTNHLSLRPQPNIREQDTQFVLKPKAMTPVGSSDREWENTTVLAGSIQELGGHTTSKADKKKKGRRIGPLAEETAKKAAQVRNAGACWRCWSLHMPVCW